MDLGINGIVDAVEVGRGGFAVVYRGFQPAFERMVAVKVVNVAVLDEKTRSSFDRECRAIGRLSGRPNILTVHEAGLTASGHPYLVMAYLPRGSLEDRLENEGPLHWTEAVDIARKLARALEFAHQEGILHRDVKPANILLTDDGEPQLADFGIARITEATRASRSALAFTPVHAPPEAFESKSPTPASDIYSLGSTLFALLAGRPAFLETPDDSVFVVMSRVAGAPVPDLAPFGVPSPVCAVVERAMAKEPADRPASGAVFAEELEEARREAIAPDPPPAPRPPPPSAPAGRRKVVLGSAAAAVLVVLALVVRSIVTDQDPPPPPPSTELLLHDEFADRSSGWTEIDTEVSSLAYRDGQYRIAIKKPPFSQTSDSRLEGTAFRADLVRLADTSVEVDATLSAPVPDGLFGLVCRQQGTGGHHYVGLVSVGGSWGIFRSGDELKTLTRGETPLSAGEAAGTLRVRLDCSGGNGTPVSIRLFLNGRMIAEASDSNSLPPGLVGLTVRSQTSPVEVRFDKLDIRRSTVVTA